jgi:hypothetical protein
MENKMENMKTLFPSKLYIPLALQRKYKIVGASGGPNHNAMPIRNDFNPQGKELGWMIPNETIIIGVDYRLDLGLTKKYYNPTNGWGLIQMLDGGLFTVSDTGLNGIEYRGHLSPFDLIEEPEPEVPGDMVEMELYQVKVEFDPKFKIFITFKKG